MRMAGNAGPFAQYCVANRFRCTASLRALLLILHKITSLPFSFDCPDRLPGRVTATDPPPPPRRGARAVLLPAAYCALLLVRPLMATGAAPEEVVIEADRPAGGGLIAGQDQAKGVSGVGADYIEMQAPSENAFQLIKLLPGANVATSDPFGISTATSLSLRGLGQDEIGVLLDGAPQNDIGYFYAYPSQFIDTENLRQVALAPGSVDLDSPIINGVGGLLAVRSRDPADHPGGQASLTYGSYDLTRGFLRADSGAIGDLGLSAFISYSATQVDNWRGYGRDKKQHVDFKAVEEWGAGNRISIAASFNDALTTSYLQPTLAQWQQFGRGNNYDATFINAANPAGDANYWKLYLDSFRNLYFSLPSHFTLTDRLTLEVTPYVQTGYGNSPYGTTLSTTGNFLGTAPIAAPLALPNAQDGTAVVMADYTGDQFRAGSVLEAQYQCGNHTLIAGVWFDYADDVDQQPFTGVNGGGGVPSLWAYPSTVLKLPDGTIYYALDDHTVTRVESGFVADRALFLDGRLRVEAGFKAVYTSRNGSNNLPGPQYDISNYNFDPLPRASVRYQIDPRQQLFANVTTSFRAPNEYDFFNAYSGGALSSVASAHLKSEHSVSEEIGYRYQDTLVSGGLTLFNYDFADRQIATVIDQGGALINATINAGGQTSRGVDGEIGLRPVYHLSPYLSGEVLDATITGDIPVNGDLLPSKGKTAVRSPRLQGAFGLAYRDQGLFGSVSVKYLGSQYATFVDDEKIPGFSQLDAALGYDFGDLAQSLRHPEIRVNLSNLTDAKILSGVAGVTTNANSLVGRLGTTIPGTSPTYYIGAGFAASVTLSTAF